jgi:UDP-N-acetylmuramoyl-L-alanyl-D-glutamate--2,6-diaminopimelate ligase
MEDYYAAKASLFKMAEHKIVNADDEYGKRLAREYPDVVKCSLKRKCCDFFADDVVDKGMDGSEYRLVSRNRHFKVRSHLVGDFNIMNTLQAAACASLLGVSLSGISGAISSLRGVVGRLERVKLDAITDFKIFIDYAHTPDALENLLLTVSRSKECGERIVLLFGCGGDRDKSKRKRMGEIAREYADKIIVTSDNSRSEDPENIIAQILEGIGAAEHTVIVNRADAIDYAVKTAQKGDVILLVGKGHELYEIDKDGRRHFDERKIAAEAARKYFY